MQEPAEALAAELKAQAWALETQVGEAEIPECQEL